MKLHMMLTSPVVAIYAVTENRYRDTIVWSQAKVAVLGQLLLLGT